MSEIVGNTYQDAITGFTGVAIGHVVYMTGCHQTLLQPRSADPTKRPDAEWFDDQRLHLVPGMGRLTLDNSATPGCDRQAPKR